MVGFEIKMAKYNALPIFIYSLCAVRRLLYGILDNVPLPVSNDLLAADRECGSVCLVLSR